MYLLVHSVSIYGFTFSDTWIQETSGNKNAIMILIIIVDVLIIITAALGIYGIKKAKPCLLFLFTILVGIFCVVLVVAGILAAVAPDSMIKADMCSPNTTVTDQWFKDIIILEGSSVLFCNALCPCNLTDISKYSQPDQTIITQVYKARNGTDLQVQSCKNFSIAVSANPDASASILTYITPLSQLESALSCTGWCGLYPSGDYFYKFTNVQNGKPVGYCFNELRNWVVKWARVMEYTCFAVSGALLLVFLFNMCICCHPDRRTKRMSDRFYDPAVNTDYRSY